MSDDLAVPQLDEPAVEPAPATSGPARVTHVLGSQGRDRGGLPALAGWLLVAIAAVGFLASTPPSAGSDEPVHQATAWYLSGHVLLPDRTAEFSVPAQLLVGLVRGPCYATNQAESAGCMPARNREMGSFPYGDTLHRYPPPYYWVVGAGE